MGFFVVVASEGACIDLSAHATAARDAVCACKAKGQKKKKKSGGLQYVVRLLSYAPTAFATSHPFTPA